MDKILVTGATGKTCSFLVPALLEAGHQVRVFVRNNEKAAALMKAGADIYVGDLNQEETIDDALEGIDRVYLCIWNGPTAARQGKNVIQAIKRVGSNPIVVRHSAFGSENSDIIQQVNEADNTLKESGIPWTILKPTFFMQNLVMASHSIKTDGNIYWDWDEGKVGMIDIRDVAECAFGALTGKAELDKEYILTGPKPVSMHDVASSFSSILGKRINYVAVPFEVSKDSMKGMGFSEYTVDCFIELNKGFSQGIANTSNNNVETLTGHIARSIDDFTKDFSTFFA